MIPLRDNTGASRAAPANLLLVAANIAIFVYELQLGAAAESLLMRMGMIPSRVVHWVHQPQYASVLSPPLTLVTSLFLHGGFLHIAGNMLYLFIFGAAVEARMGHLRYLIFFIVAGIVSGVAMVVMDPGSRVPVVGASGAIAGVLGAYFIFFPRARITTVLPLFIFIELIQIPAVVYLLLWFALQLYAGVESRTAAHGAMMGGVAWWAHVGGFLFGVAAAPLIASRSSGRGQAIRRW